MLGTCNTLTRNSTCMASPKVLSNISGMYEYFHDGVVRLELGIAHIVPHPEACTFVDTQILGELHAADQVSQPSTCD